MFVLFVFPAGKKSSISLAETNTAQLIGFLAHELSKMPKKL
jgi:hypothetical protein